MFNQGRCLTEDDVDINVDPEDDVDIDVDPKAGVSGNDFWTFGNGNGNGSAHSQTLGTGTGMINCIPNFWERERE